MKEKYFSQDITFCANKKCKRKTCKRHPIHIDRTVKPYQSICNFTNSKLCPKNRGGSND